MGSIGGPVIVRPGANLKSPEAPSFIKPGLHSHNTKRRLRKVSVSLAILTNLRVLLLIVGVCGLGYYAYTLSDEYVYQAYQNWAFDQQIAGRAAVTFGDYLREATPFGFLAGGEKSRPNLQAPNSQSPASSEISRPLQGSLLGRVSIERLNLSAMVREGVDANTLKLAVGHVPSTALAGQTGNFAIAAHRDTLFRGLKDIKGGDIVTFQSPSGTYEYRVISTKIVKPSDISVLQPDGGNKLLTMITCYPFYYVGAAPKRFIVQAQMVSSSPELSAAPSEEQKPTPPARIPATLREPRNTKKRNFWHKLLHKR
ncbi:MAG: class D sortase [Bryobacteraceae bacterium]